MNSLAANLARRARLVAICSYETSPHDTVEKMSIAAAHALGQADVRAKLESRGIDATPGSPAQLSSQIQGDLAKWTTIISAAGIRID